MQGLGPLNYENRQGLYRHPTVAVTPDRVPLYSHSEFGGPGGLAEVAQCNLAINIAAAMDENQPEGNRDSG
jgi:hypothetical protein